MKRSHLFVSACCLIALAAGAAIGQPEKKADPKALPAAQPHAEKGAPGKDDMGGDQMAQMKKAWEEASAVNDMHKFLAAGCGEWTGKVKMWMDPSAEPDVSECTTIQTSMMGGRFIKGETVGTMKDFDGKPMKFEGFGIYGYNNATKQFESTWCDNMGTMQMHFTGTLSADKKVLTWETKFFCPMMHQDTWMREVQTFTSADTMTLEMWGPDMTGKNKEAKCMEISYTRKTASKEMKPAVAPKTGK